MLPVATVSVVASTVVAVVGTWGRIVWLWSEDKTVSDVRDIGPSDAPSAATTGGSRRSVWPQHFIFLNTSQVWPLLSFIAGERQHSWNCNGRFYKHFQEVLVTGLLP